MARKTRSDHSSSTSQYYKSSESAFDTTTAGAGAAKQANASTAKNTNALFVNGSQEMEYCVHAYATFQTSAKFDLEELGNMAQNDLEASKAQNGRRSKKINDTNSHPPTLEDLDNRTDHCIIPEPGSWLFDDGKSWQMADLADGRLRASR